MALSDGLIRSFEFESDATDDVAGNDGAETAVTHSAALEGNGAFGNGTTSLIDLGTSADLNITGDLSFEAWVYRTGSVYCFLVARMTGSGGAANTYEFRIASSDALEFTTTSGNGTASGPASVPKDEWVQCLVTKSGTTVTCYVNATPGSPVSVSGTTSLASEHTYLGTRGDFFTFLGASGFALDKVRIWNRAITADEVTELYNSGAGRSSEYILPAPPPTLTSIDPEEGVQAGGTEVTLTGSDFIDGATVMFGGVAAASVEFVSDTELIATTPAGAAGEIVDVMVTNPDDQADTLADAFEYVTLASLEAAPTYTKYGSHLVKLLPPGKLWNLEGDSELRKTLLALGDEFQRVEDRGADLIEESDPRTADETIGDWEEMVGLPDEQVTAISAVLAERRVAVVQKLVGRSGQNLDFYERLCEACGYPLLSLTKHAGDVLRSGTAQCGEIVVGIDDAYTITLELDTPTAGALTEAQFEAVIRASTHSHIQVVFTY